MGGWIKDGWMDQGWMELTGVHSPKCQCGQASGRQLWRMIFSSWWQCTSAICFPCGSTHCAFRCCTPPPQLREHCNIRKAPASNKTHKLEPHHNQIESIIIRINIDPIFVSNIFRDLSVFFGIPGMIEILGILVVFCSFIVRPVHQTELIWIELDWIILDST